MHEGKLRATLKSLSDRLSCNHSCVVCGDFNLPDIGWYHSPDLQRCTPTSRIFLELCLNFKLSQMVISPTLGFNTLDLVLTNDRHVVRSVCVEAPIGTSDQAIVRFELNLAIATNDEPHRYRRNFKLADYDKIYNYLCNVDWYGSLNLVNSVN